MPLFVSLETFGHILIRVYFGANYDITTRMVTVGCNEPQLITRCKRITKRRFPHRSAARNLSRVRLIGCGTVNKPLK